MADTGSVRQATDLAVCLASLVAYHHGAEQPDGPETDPAHASRVAGWGSAGSQ
jgi:hypothetical protein